MKYLITLSLSLFSVLAMAQDCQLISMSLTIPEGVTKHHFPAQALPTTAEQDFFTFLSEWNEGELVVRMRFSNDRENWTKWEVLKRDYTQPTAKNSPLHLASESYEYFEWAVYNKAGTESELSLNFYYPTIAPAFADIASADQMTISTVGCPQPMLVDPVIDNSVVTTNEDKD